MGNRCWGRTRNLHRCGRVGEWRYFCDEHKLQPIQWIFVLVFVIGVGIIAYIQYFESSNLIPKKLKNSIQKFLYEEKIEPFKKGDFGIIVANFIGESRDQDEKGAEIKGNIVTTLKARFNELNIQNTRIVKLSSFENINTHEAARKIGEKYTADIVIWGKVTIAGYIPCITIIELDPEIYPELLTLLKGLKNITVLDDKFTYEALKNVADIRLPAFTDDPTRIALFVSGLNKLNSENYDKAVEYFELSLPNNPKTILNSAVIYSYLGVAYLGKKDYEKTIFNCNLALSIDPDCSIANFVISICYYLRKNYSLTIEFGQKFIKQIYPKADDSFLSFLSCTFLNLIKEYKLAIDMATDFLNTSQNNKDSLFCYACRSLAYMGTKDYQQAINDLNKAFSLTQNKRLAILLLSEKRGKCNFLIGNYENAIMDLTDYINTIKSDSFFNCDVYLMRGQSFHKVNKIKDAIADFNKVIKICPKSFHAYFYLGNVYYSQGDWKSAIKYYEEASEVKPEMSEPYFRTAICYEKQGIKKKAIENYQEFIKAPTPKQYSQINIAKNRIDELRN